MSCANPLLRFEVHTLSSHKCHLEVRMFLQCHKQLQRLFKCVCRLSRCPNYQMHYVTALCHTICRLVKWYMNRRNIPVLVISSAVATPPLEGKRSATSAKAAACAVMAYRGRGAVHAVGPPDVIMADNAASVCNAQDQVYALMGKSSVGAVSVNIYINMYIYMSPL